MVESGLTTKSDITDSHLSLGSDVYDLPTNKDRSSSKNKLFNSMPIARRSILDEPDIKNFYNDKSNCIKALKEYCDLKKFKITYVYTEEDNKKNQNERFICTCALKTQSEKDIILTTSQSNIGQSTTEGLPSIEEGAKGKSKHEAKLNASFNLYQTLKIEKKYGSELEFFKNYSERENKKKETKSEFNWNKIQIPVFKEENKETKPNVGKVEEWKLNSFDYENRTFEEFINDYGEMQMQFNSKREKVQLKANELLSNFDRELIGKEVKDNNYIPLNERCPIDERIVKWYFNWCFLLPESYDVKKEEDINKLFEEKDEPIKTCEDPIYKKKFNLFQVQIDPETIMELKVLSRKNNENPLSKILIIKNWLINFEPVPVDITLSMELDKNKIAQDLKGIAALHLNILKDKFWIDIPNVILETIFAIVTNFYSVEKKDLTLNFYGENITRVFEYLLYGPYLKKASFWAKLKKKDTASNIYETIMELLEMISDDCMKSNAKMCRKMLTNPSFYRIPALKK